jgi:hypothetical protein
MAICRKCGEHFPNRIYIDGKERVLNSRKYCLICSLFNSRNTRKLEQIEYYN